MRVVIIQRSEDYKNAQRYAEWTAGRSHPVAVPWVHHINFPDLHFAGERTCHLLLTCAEVSTFRMEIAIYKYVPFLTLPWPAFCFACGCGRDQISEAEASGQRPASQPAAS